MADTRLSKLTKQLQEKGFAALAVNAGPTLTYLTGLHFHLMERPVVMIFCIDQEPTIILPELEQAKLDHLPFPVRVFAYGENPDAWGEIFGEALAGLGLAGRKVGVEPRQLRLLEYDYLRSACGEAVFTDGSAIVTSLRARKDDEEIACMRRAVQIAEDALMASLPLAKVGVSEKDIAAELFLQLIRHGADTALPFAPIVAAGPNGANPHAQPSDRQLTAGDLLIVDWGAAYGGYAADLTRTFAVGETLDAEAEKIHKLVQAANRAGREAGGPGVPCARVDEAARRGIAAAGYGAYFTHRTGHGIGMECHEEPYIRGDNEQLLEIGMAYTVEPGIYLPGKNGVRIEDDVVVTATGSESLSTMSREIRFVG
ncbi:MAG TPA: aminopeptidase P family protein [Desulfobulbaceae bacterium]|nr:aminopeptidase P family protein [Desulfobulbaceae bacterium]